SVPKTSKGLALTTDCNSMWVKAHPHMGTQGAVAEAARNVACTGAKPLAVTDCLNFGNPERPEVMWEFVQAIEGMGVALRTLGIPVVSGNVSLYNETSSVSVHPTPGIGLVGLMEDRSTTVGLGLPEEGQRILLLGDPTPTFGASAYGFVVHGVETGAPPAVDWDAEKALIATLCAGIGGGLITAAHDAADGGLGVALAEMALAGGRQGNIGDGIGAAVALSGNENRERLLFGETHGCAFVTAEEDQVVALLALAAEHGCPAHRVGTVGGDSLVVTDEACAILDVPVADLRAAWEGGLVDAVGLDPLSPRP
ncbi:MAG: phosphoribosylformylglycinamidine synthase II, partial [Deltaproteobacteria bacterium]|nr:phosphoribosylformylglycinamidine synthase II [Deltaproteobacteria bacterium]